MADELIPVGQTSSKKRLKDEGDGSWAEVVAIGAGTAILGKVGIDQTTPGTTNGVQVNAGEAHIGAVGGTTVTPSATFSRPNNVIAYAAGQQVADSTSAPTVLSFANVARVAAGSGIIVNARLLDEANQATAGQFELWLFGSVAPTSNNDGAAMALSQADAERVTAVIPLTTNYVGNAGAGAAGNRVYVSDPVNRGFKLAAGTTLYGLLVVRNAYTPVALEKFTVTLTVLQD